MKKIILTIAISLMMLLNLQAQGRGNAVYQEVKNKDVINSVFPSAQKIEKENAFWFKIVDANQKQLGYVLSSMPYCKEVIGYNDATPVLVITDNNMRILKVQLLSHWETASYIQRLETKGFFKQWNGKSFKQAKNQHIDGYTGATLTAKAVDKNVQFLIENGLKNLPIKK